MKTTHQIEVDVLSNNCQAYQTLDRDLTTLLAAKRAIRWFEMAIVLHVVGRTSIQLCTEQYHIETDTNAEKATLGAPQIAAVAEGNRRVTQ